MEVQVQVQRRAEALEEGDRAALLRAHAPVPANAPPQLGEQRAQEGAEHFARELAIVGAAVAKRVRKREHPLPDRHRGEHAEDEMRRGVRHAAAAAGGAEAAALARERHEAIVAALVAAQAQEAVGEDAAAQEGAELLLDEVRRWTLPRSRAREEGLELLADDAMQKRVLPESAVCTNRRTRPSCRRSDATRVPRSDEPLKRGRRLPRPRVHALRASPFAR